MHNILVVVPQIPRFDQNAGDWRIYSICRILKRTHGVYVLPLGYRWQGEHYVRQLRREGIHVLFPGNRGMYGFDRLLDTYGFTSVIFEHFYVAAEFKPFLFRIPRVIIDTHHIDFMQRRGFLGLNDQFEKYSEVQELMRHGREFELDIYRMADELIAISEKDKRVLQKYLPTKKISVVPTCVETHTARGRRFDERADMVFFASFMPNAVNPNVDAVRYFTRDILPLINIKAPGAGFTAAGANAPLLPNKGIGKIEGVKTIHQLLGAYRVVVCPLRFGGGTKKKILDAAAAGTPVVTTSVGADGLDFVDGKEIFIADDAATFARRVVQLYRDRVLWEKMSRNALARVARCYDIRVMERTLRQCIGGKHA